jgi:hypothetical protein
MRDRESGASQASDYNRDNFSGFLSRESEIIDPCRILYAAPGAFFPDWPVD